MQTHNLKRNTKRVTSKRIGRGGKRGTTSGRGTKGQKARSGAKIRPEYRDVIKKIPKMRGYRYHKIQSDPQAVNLSSLEKMFKDGSEVDFTALVDAGLVDKFNARNPRVKILAKGEIKKKLTMKGLSVSASAKVKIIKAGGKVE